MGEYYLAIDQAHEQNNTLDEGAISLTDNPSALQHYSSRVV